MSQATASLFGGLATGIFGRMHEHEQEQTARDHEEKKQALSSLSSLLEQATPETRPVIYKQMADVMKLTGKHRGVWDMLTGQGRQDYHDQLSGQLDNVFGNVVGPERYEQLKSHATPGVASVQTYARMPSGATQAMTPDQTQGKVALDDPTLNRLKLMQAQYGLQAGNKSANNWDAAEANKYRQLAVAEGKNDLTLERLDQTSRLKAQQEVNALADALAGMSYKTTGIRTPLPEHIQQAAEMVAHKWGLKQDQTQALINQYNSKTELNKFQAQGGGINPLTGLPEGKPMTQGQQFSLDASQRKEGAATYQNWNKAKATITKLDTEHQAVRKQLNQIASANGLQFDETNGQFLDSKTGKPVDPDTLPVSSKQLRGMLDKMAKLAADKAASYQELQGHRATLEGQFAPLYKFNGEWDVQPSDMGGLAPAGAPRNGQPPPLRMEGAGAPQAGDGHQLQSRDPHPNGEIVTLKGEKYRVKGISGKSEDGLITYKLEKVQ